MTIALYVDGIEEPKNKNKEWIIVRSEKEAKEYIKENGVPSYISFGQYFDKNDCSGILKFVIWMINQDLKENKCKIPENFSYNIHSSSLGNRMGINYYFDRYYEVKNTIQNTQILLEGI